MITNHGIHQWDVIPGLPDTGGQNVFVNQFTRSLAQAGYRITIVNRGGYPHPRTGEDQVGLKYGGAERRILYLQDGFRQFVRKEDMSDRIPALAEDLGSFAAEEGSEVTAIISHYWDAGLLGMLWNRAGGKEISHIWIPHSLGAIKRRNVAAKRWAPLRIQERIEAEETLLREVTAVAATSSTIRASLESDYGYAGKVTFLPPCVDPDRYHPRVVDENDPIWAFLRDHAGGNATDLPRRKIVTEISRTDRTKRKDVLIRAFARVQPEIPDSLLVISIDVHETDLAKELRTLIGQQDLDSSTVIVGSVWDELPKLYAISEVYCTPSIMEGFGMSAQEAAATAVPVVASDLVPFATEYLLGEDVREISVSEEGPYLRQGEGAIVVKADDVEGFAAALRLLLDDGELRDAMGQSAHSITIPAFTWSQRTRSFLKEMSLPMPKNHE